MNIISAFLVNPFAMEHARGVLDKELEMLSEGIGKKKRIEWLTAVRTRMTDEAALVVPSLIAPYMESLTTTELEAGFKTTDIGLRQLGFGRTFRALRASRRKLGLRGEVLDPLSVQGALLQLAGDEDAATCLQRMVTPLMVYFEASEVFHASEETFAKIMSGEEDLNIRRRKAAEFGLTVIPNILATMPDLPEGFIRDLAFIRGKLLDQSVYESVSAVIRELGEGIIEELRPTIMADTIQSYVDVLCSMINTRLTELEGASQRSTLDVATHEVQLPPEKSFDQLPLLMTMKEAADLLRVSRTTIHRKLKDGSLDGRHVGVNHLILTESVKKYLDLEKKSRLR